MSFASPRAPAPGRRSAGTYHWTPDVRYGASRCIRRAIAHAYTLPRNTANSRVKDLVDLALLIGSDGLDKQRILDALRLTFERSGTHDQPVSLVPPSADWQIQFQALAEECGLSPDVSVVFEGVREYLNEVLTGRTER